jgi:hypothetical protein
MPKSDLAVAHGVELARQLPTNSVKHCFAASAKISSCFIIPGDLLSYKFLKNSEIFENGLTILLPPAIFSTTAKQLKEEEK